MLDTFQQMGRKLTKWFGEPNFGLQSASLKEMERAQDIFSAQPLAQILPYEAYDEENGIFIGKNSLGFAIEAIPLVGGEEATQKEIASLFEEILEEDASIQCLLWADHRIDPFLNAWENSRRPMNEVYREMAQRRTGFLRKSKQTSPRLFRFILSYSIPFKGSIDPIQMEDLKSKKEKILKTLKTLTYAFSWNVKHLLETVGGMVSFSFQTDVKKREWNPYDTLSSQLSLGGVLRVEEDCLEIQHETQALFKSFRVTDFPEYWSFSSMQRLIGDVLRDNFRINQPFYLHYGVHCPKQAKLDSQFWRKSQLIEKQGKSYTLLRMIPDLEDELKECDQIRRNLNQGSRFVWTQFSCGIWSSKEEINEASQSIKSIFRINQFSLAENRCLHLPQFLASLPMTWSEYVNDLKVMNLLKTTITTECVNFVPLQGEWVGTSTPNMLLLGRRGQLMNWNPFDNKSGNYNAVVVGRSGTGKSVFMQELILNGLATGAKVFVLEVGRSFEKMCDSLNGQYIQFTKETNICLNPFSAISQIDAEERDTAFSFFKSIIACMAAPAEGTTDYENALIEKAIRHVWENKKSQATITDVMNYLLSNHEDSRAMSLGVMLTPYSKGGIYAKYFENENNVNFFNPLVLIELEELKDKKDLQCVVMQLFIMTIANQAFLGDRKTPFYICIDEAWDLLRGKQTGVFIETLARRLRKYNGSLVIGTQSIEDFFVTPGAQAAFENSDWMCLLAQKKSSISRLVETGKLDMDDHKKYALESVTTRHGEYSEIMICDADGNYSIARLVLDPFSQLLYSTKAQEYAHLKELTAQGMTITEAINHVLAQKGQYEN
jgi:conjugal transfer ATP-binding protein TraC